ncbi:hypothetical protein AM588_10001275 [Phytophthora nicotianae]|uniref:pectinesterase n=1 Tax=Phytophthora nicotianae TaxID=4792 RepID=A0A0W8CS60_PHYNI|nr:hypothetical protein AM588_10001275 [Phytophthora nicotianae]
MAQRDLPLEIKNGRNDLITGLIEKLGQAVAVYVDATNYGFYGCNFTGYKDTLCAHRGRQLYARSFISGDGVFDSCDIESIGEGYITANGNSNSTIESQYVFNRARVLGSSGNGSTYLGRPWRPYARVVWQNSELSDVVNPKGWSTWHNDSNTANVYFMEFNNSGPGAIIDQRVPFSGQLEAPVVGTDILGENYKSEWWVDTNFF